MSELKFNRMIEAFDINEDLEDEQPSVPATEIQPEMVPADTVQPSEDIVKNAYVDNLNQIIQKAWELISDLHGTIATVETSEDKVPNQEQFINNLNSSVDQATVVVGLLTNAMSIIDPELMNAINDVNKDQEPEIEQE